MYSMVRMQHTHIHTHTHPHMHIQSHHTYLTAQRNMWHKHAERTRRLVATPALELGEPEFIPFPDRPTISTIFTFSTPIRPTLPPPPPRVLREDVTLRDVVTYRGNTITVSRGGEVVRR